MKKIFSFKTLICIGLLLAMLFSFVACASEEVNGEEAVPQKKGNFYTLQEAYDQGLLTVDDLKNIAYFQNGESPDENFVPTSKNPETLSAETENAIKETKAYDYRNDTVSPKNDAIPNAYRIVKYFGTYKNSVAIMIESDYYDHDDAEWDIYVEGVLFKYNNGNRIYIFKAN